MATVKPEDQQSIQLDDRLFNLFNKLVPLVDNVSDGVRAIALLAVVITAWLFVWMFFIQHFSLTTALVVGGIIFLPGLILLRYWRVLEDVKNLPDIAREMMKDVGDDVKSTCVHTLAGYSGKYSAGTLKPLSESFFKVTRRCSPRPNQLFSQTA